MHIQIVIVFLLEWSPFEKDSYTGNVAFCQSGQPLRKIHIQVAMVFWLEWSPFERDSYTGSHVLLARVVIL